MDTVDSFTKMVMCMRENGKMTRLMDEEFIFIMMGQSMKESGRMICSTARVQKYGKMLRSILGRTKMERKMDLVHLSGSMVAILSDNLSIMIFQVRVYTPGLMDDAMKDNGSKTKCMVKVLSPGLTADAILAPM